MSHQIQTNLHKSLLEYAREGQRLKRNERDKFDESNMSGDAAQAQLFEKVIYFLKKRFAVRYLYNLPNLSWEARKRVGILEKINLKDFLNTQKIFPTFCSKAFP